MSLVKERMENGDYCIDELDIWRAGILMVWAGINSRSRIF